MKKLFRIFLSLPAVFALTSCGMGLFDVDNTPAPSRLVGFHQELRVNNVWYHRTGPGVGNENIKLVPATSATSIFTASENGNVTALDKVTGHSIWVRNAGISITGGAGVGDGIVVVCGRAGEVVAMDQMDGHILWHTHSTSEILAAPAVGGGVVVTKAVDGNIETYSSHDGHDVWNYQQVEPTLILRGSSAPQIKYDSTVIGFANGNLIKLTLRGGNLIWQQTIAIPQGSFSIQRLVDIDADPYIFGKRVYAATYQGNIAALDLPSGQPIWTHAISSYTGLTADPERVFVTDARSHVWAFDADNANVEWQLRTLESRNITGPVLMGPYLVVGDAQGYLHWMSRQDGHFVARTRVNSSGIIATPVVDNNVLYVLTRDGHLAAYTIG